MTNITSHEEFMYKVRDRHADKYIYDLCNYEDSQTEVTIVCRDHGVFSQLPIDHIKGGGCPTCIKNKPNDDFARKAKKVHGDKYRYYAVEYKNLTTLVKIACGDHGFFEVTPDEHLNGKGCPVCDKRKREDEFRNTANLIHDNKYSYRSTNYVNPSSKVIIHCSKHGDFLQTPRNHLNGKGCPKCASGELTTEDFIELAYKAHDNENYTYDRAVYTGTHNKLIITCYKHGDFLQAPSNHLRGDGCPVCAESGFNPAKDSVFYVYTFGKYVGFGISNTFEKRHNQHLSSFKKAGATANLLATYNLSGESAQSLESNVKRTLPITNTGIEGFKTEAVGIKYLNDLLLMITNHITSNLEET